MAHVAGWGVVADVRQHIYEHLQRLSLRFYEDKQTGQLMSRMVNDSDLFEQLIAHAIPDVLVNVLTLVGVSVGAVRHELAAGAADPGAHPADRPGDAQLCRDTCARLSASGSTSWASSTPR